MLSRWDPFAELSRLQDEVFGTTPARQGFTPRVDIHEDDGAIYLDADVAGLEPSDVKINVENNVLTISGERKLDRDEKKGGYHRIERVYGRFSRSFALPKTVKDDQIEANLKNGVLRVRLPKQPTAQRREVQVRSN